MKSPMKATEQWRPGHGFALGATLLKAANVCVKAMNAVKRR